MGCRRLLWDVDVIMGCKGYYGSLCKGLLWDVVATMGCREP